MCWNVAASEWWMGHRGPVKSLMNRKMCKPSEYNINLQTKDSLSITIKYGIGGGKTVFERNL